MPEVDVCDSLLGFLHSNRAVSQVAKEFGKPHFYHQRGNLDPRRFGRNRLFKRAYLEFIEKPILKRASALIALSPREKDVFSALVPFVRCEVIPNGVDVEDWCRPAEAKGRLSSVLSDIGEAPLLIWYGRMIELKGPDTFVRAFARAHQQHPGLRAIVAGPDEDGLSAECQRIASEAGISKDIHFLGMLTGEDRRAILQRADVFTQPTQGEGLSMAILKALACGCQILTTPQANIPEIESCGAGRIVALDDRAISEAMLELSSCTSSRSLSSNARSLVVERYSMDVVVGQYLELYAQVSGQT
jgi:glycosyltransferase involved in cell wall biosynthesis